MYKYLIKKDQSSNVISPQKNPHDSCMTFTPSPEPRSTTTQQQRCCRLTFQRAQPLSGPGIKTAATKEKKPLIYR